MNNNFQPGDIIVKRTYKKNDDGSKGELLVTFAMMKHDEGYNPDGGEWEWAKMPAKGTDLDMYPNGKLPAQDSKMRGKMQGCIDCHAKADGNDFVFSK
ncbi:MAG: cytochrome P460 family protein [Bacteroidota bacterium]